MKKKRSNEIPKVEDGRAPAVAPEASAALTGAAPVDMITLLPDTYFNQLRDECEIELKAGRRPVILGNHLEARRLIGSIAPEKRASLRAFCPLDSSVTDDIDAILGVTVRSLEWLTDTETEVLIIAEDRRKEDVLRAALPYIRGCPKVILAGYGHYAYREPSFEEELRNLDVPSLANGYPNVLVHLHQCLANAFRLGLRGVVVELGMFRGGTTLFMSRVIQRLGANWPILGFDTFAGFPERRSILDMYAHPDCVWTDQESVRGNLDGRNVKFVIGDIVETCARLKNEDIVLSFFDTDNYSPAKAALQIVRERTMVGGAIVFDHFTGVDRFRYTLGERMAAQSLLADPCYFNLHGTGVFYRQR